MEATNQLSASPVYQDNRKNKLNQTQKCKSGHAEGQEHQAGVLPNWLSPHYMF